MFNIIPVLQTIAPIVGGIAGIVNSINNTPSTTTAPVVIEKSKCEVIDKPKTVQPPIQMPNIVFNLNIYVNGEKAVGSKGGDGIYIETK